MFGLRYVTRSFFCVEYLLLTFINKQKGALSLARASPYEARADLETALTHFPDHPGAIVALSNILLDIYAEKLLPPPAVPGLDLGGASLTDSESLLAHLRINEEDDEGGKFPALPSTPLGLGPRKPGKPTAARSEEAYEEEDEESENGGHALLGPELPPPYKATSLPINDRLSARDRAYGLLSGLTKLGSGWNDSEAWFALARAYEESGQPEKARAALWWCVELEDGRGVREWGAVISGGGYVL